MHSDDPSPDHSDDDASSFVTLLDVHVFVLLGIGVETVLLALRNDIGDLLVFLPGIGEITRSINALEPRQPVDIFGRTLEALVFLQSAYQFGARVARFFVVNPSTNQTHPSICHGISFVNA